MPVMTSVSTGRESAPTGYREVLYWRIGEKWWRSVIMTLLGALSLPPWWFVFTWLGRTVGDMPLSIQGSLPQLGLILVGATLTVVILHELTHALTMKVVGAPVRFGVLYFGLMAYATAPGHAFSRSQFVAIALAPLVGLSLLALLGMLVAAGTLWVGFIALCAILNAAGAIGDLWLVSLVLRYPPYALVVDERDGTRILLPVSDQSLRKQRSDRSCVG